MSIFKFLKGHVLGVFVICIFLIFEAIFELQLPTIMSEIIDVGIQQSGIEYPTPKRIGAKDLAELEMFMTDDDIALVEKSYSAPNENGTRFLNKNVTDKEKAATGSLGSALSLPECAAISLKNGVDVTTIMQEAQSAQTPSGKDFSKMLQSGNQNALLGSMGDAFKDGKIDLAEVYTLYNEGIITKEMLLQDTKNISEQMGEISGSIVSQRAISYVQEIYKDQGLNLDNMRMDYLVKTAWRMLGVCIGMGVSAIIVAFLASRMAAKIAQNTRSALFSKIMNFGAAEIDKFSNASLITRSTNDVTQVQMAIVMLLRMVFLAPIMAIVALVQVSVLQSGLEWIIAVAVIVIAAVMGTLFGLTMPKFKRMQSLIDRVNLVVRDMLDGLLPIRAYVREDYEEARFEKASKALMKTQLFTNRAMSLSMPAIMLVMNLISLLIVWVGASAIDTGSLQVGTMMAFISYTMEIVISFMILAMVAIMLPRADVSAKRIFEVMQEPISVKDPEKPLALPAARDASLTFENVTFSYPGADAPVLRNISFTTHPHETVAIIGPTGSGKSTVAKLIPRLFDPTEGRITLDGVDIKDVTLENLRDRVGFVPQQGLLFSGTIEDNIKFADSAITDEMMAEAAGIAQAKDFIEEKEDGYQSHVAQKGANVSGGQRQRLSIARALAKEPEILVLDDSFSALDYATDAKLRKALAEKKDAMAQIVVAQRVASIMHAAEIIVLNQGEMVGRGTHEELLKTCPTYLEIASSQLSNKELGMTDKEVEKILASSEEKIENQGTSEIHTLEKDEAGQKAEKSATGNAKKDVVAPRSDVPRNTAPRDEAPKGGDA